MGEYKVTETWSMFVSVYADSKEEAVEIASKMLHAGKMDDVEYHGSDDDGVEDLATGVKYDNDFNEV